MRAWCVKCPSEGLLLYTTASIDQELPKMLLHVKTGISWDEYYANNGYKVVQVEITEAKEDE